MATGPEHYRMAEELMRMSAHEFRGEALIHATLALAAATALKGQSIELREWRQVAEHVEINPNG